jgi:hypothetical protein
MSTDKHLPVTASSALDHLSNKMKETIEKQYREFDSPYYGLLVSCDATQVRVSALASSRRIVAGLVRTPASRRRLESWSERLRALPRCTPSCSCMELKWKIQLTNNSTVQASGPSFTAGNNLVSASSTKLQFRSVLSCHQHTAPRCCCYS